MNFKKISCLTMCAIMLTGTMVACDDEKNSEDSDQTIAMEDLPYGATMRKLVDTDTEVCFDHRFITDDEMKKIADYYFSIQNKDMNLFAKTQNPDYIEYIEKNSGESSDTFLDTIYSDNAAEIGEGFKYSYIEAVECGDATQDDGIDEIISLMDSIYKENNKNTTFTDTVRDSKFITLNLTAEVDGKTYNSTNQIIYLFNCTDGIYIFN